MTRKGNNVRFAFFFVLLLSVVASCGVKYSFSGGSIPKDMKTYSVLYFENLAPMVYPTLSQNFTEALKERIRTQSSLSQVNNDGDAIFEGVITNYTITPASIGAGNNDRAQNSRLSITVKVKYTNKLDLQGRATLKRVLRSLKNFRART
ncbi:LptE family protein [Sphingobacterium sp. T2]|uniref:LptE family protein n=1 Tax=Sphingobacterium sp. T2 TaxID=1590596 RepID=UPI000A6FAC99|nr:LptE family protein [Sphingobacterium sp. T2]